MSIAKTFVIYDPFCASRGSNVVHRGFKSKEAADKRLSALLKSDYDGYAGCVPSRPGYFMFRHREASDGSTPPP